MLYQVITRRNDKTYDSSVLMSGWIRYINILKRKCVRVCFSGWYTSYRHVCLSLLQLGLQLGHVFVCWKEFVFLPISRRGLEALWRDKHLEQNKSHSPSQPLIPWVRLVSCGHTHTHAHTHNRHEHTRLHTAAVRKSLWFGQVLQNKHIHLPYVEFKVQEQCFLK